MNDYDCICEYEIDHYTTAAGNTLDWCPNCGSLRMSGAPQMYPRYLSKAKDEIVKIRGQLREVEEFDKEDEV